MILLLFKRKTTTLATTTMIIIIILILVNIRIVIMREEVRVLLIIAVKVVRKEGQTVYNKYHYNLSLEGKGVALFIAVRVSVLRQGRVSSFSLSCCHLFSFT